MLSMPTTFDPELERADREDRVAEARDRAVQEYLDGIASMSAQDWTKMLTHHQSPMGWGDDDEFCEQVGAQARAAFESGLGI